MFTVDGAPSKRVSLNLAVGTAICPVASIGNYQAEEPDFGQTGKASLVISLRVRRNRGCQRDLCNCPGHAE